MPEEKACARILHWLLNGPAVLQAGPQRGGVCGWLDEHGPVFVYTEAAGYYLTALAAVADVHPEHLEASRARAALVVTWLEAQVRNGDLPPTRIYLRPHADDWRCDARFAFDLAVLARGLHDASTLVPPGRIPPLVACVLNELDRLVDERDTLRAYRSMCATVDPPERWSTRRGFYQLKLAAALRTRPLPLSNGLALACQRIAEEWADLPSLSGALHPHLYGLEGCALFAIASGDRSLLLRVGASLHRALGQRLQNGCVTNDTGDGMPRTDVVAQALRLAALTAGAIDPRDAAVLRASLERRVDHDGAVVFGLTDGARSQRNVWAALFAWQALAWDDRLRGGQAVRARDALLLI